jgi:hypothetical protein
MYNVKIMIYHLVELHFCRIYFKLVNQFFYKLGISLATFWLYIAVNSSFLSKSLSNELKSISGVFFVFFFLDLVLEDKEWSIRIGSYLKKSK